MSSLHTDADNLLSKLGPSWAVTHIRELDDAFGRIIDAATTSNWAALGRAIVTARDLAARAVHPSSPGWEGMLDLHAVVVDTSNNAKRRTEAATDLATLIRVGAGGAA